MKIDKERKKFLRQELKEYEKMQKQANRLYRTCFLCWEFLVANDLREEAYEYVCEHIDEEWPFEPLDWNSGWEEVPPWERR